jgi:hypothetical protein
MRIALGCELVSERMRAGGGTKYNDKKTPRCKNTKHYERYAIERRIYVYERDVSTKVIQWQLINVSTTDDITRRVRFDKERCAEKWCMPTKISPNACRSRCKQFGSVQFCHGFARLTLSRSVACPENITEPFLVGFVAVMSIRFVLLFFVTTQSRIPI